MTIELKVPELGESIHDVRIGQWLKREGQWVDKDEDLVEIESEKATVMLSAPQSGRLAQVAVQTGEDAKVGQVIGQLEPQSRPHAPAATPSGEEGHALERTESPAEKPSVPDEAPGDRKAGRAGGDSPPAVTGKSPRKPDRDATGDGKRTTASASGQELISPPAGPDARRALREYGLTVEEVAAEKSAKRLTRQDVEQYARGHNPAAPEHRSDIHRPPLTPSVAAGEREEEIVPMSLLRRRIAERLVQAHQQAALLTTFNEIDMSAVVALRSKYGQIFQEKYDTRLGFMSFFVKSVVEGLKEFPALNAEVRGTDIAYRNYYDIGIAVATDRGLVVPVLRSASRLSLAEIEAQIAAIAQRARQNELSPKELVGGTFSITNGGVYGSLLSTPIVNPPQSGILGLHAIQDRPTASAGQVVIRPMMYVALTYDHRVVDGREAVIFLNRVKELIEDPARMLLET